MPLSSLVIGTGNLAHHLIPKLLASSDTEVVQVLGRNRDAARRILGDQMDLYCDEFSLINSKAEIVFLMVNDSAIATLTQKLKTILSPNTLVVHFSGGTSVDAIDDYFVNKGCAWPIGSISSGDKTLDLSTLPLCVTASSSAVLNTIHSVFEPIFGDIHQVNSKQKVILHIAAVMVNNFGNHLSTMTEHLLNAESLSLDLLRPIILQTAEKIQHLSPSQVQTGPAIREDRETIQRHAEELEKYPEILEIYQLLSQSISKFHKQ